MLWEMIICDETCGEEAILAARLAPWRRVEWGPGPSRRGADGLAGAKAPKAKDRQPEF